MEFNFASEILILYFYSVSSDVIFAR